MLKLITAIFITGFLASCATVPPVTFNYYPATWNVVATVTQTVGCNAANTRLIVLNTPSVKTNYLSDFSSKPFQLDIKSLDGSFANSNITMNLTEDGRLKSLNQSTTGQGEAIVKSAVSLATSLLAFSGPVIGHGVVEPVIGELEVCADIKKWGAGKPVTLIYNETINSTKLEQTVTFDHAAPKTIYEDLRPGLPILTVTVSKISESKSGPSYEVPDAGASDDIVFLTLQKVGTVELTFADPLDTARFIVPMPDFYKLPIPKAALFGKQAFTVTLSEAGAVTAVGYGKETGAAGTLNAFGAIAATQTAAVKAADLKAQADLITQQQRLVLCETSPDECE